MTLTPIIGMLFKTSKPPLFFGLDPTNFMSSEIKSQPIKVLACLEHNSYSFLLLNVIFLYQGNFE